MLIFANALPVDIKNHITVVGHCTHILNGAVIIQTDLLSV